MLGWLLRWAGLFSVVSTLTVPQALAREVAGVDLADTIRVEQTLLTLNGAAVFKKFGVRVLVAGLWLEHSEREAATILAADAPRRYVSHFLHGVSAKKIRSAWKKGLEANSPNASPEVRQQFQDLYGWIHDFRSGDEIVFTYVPGQGSVVEINGERVGSVPGKGFADAYFALALGPKPGPGENFKKALLGR